MKKIKMFYKRRDIKVVTGMIIGTIIYCIGVVWVLDLGRFYAGGVTGVSQIITKLLGDAGINITKSIFISALNIPLFLIGWRQVSKRFALLTLASVFLQSLVIFVLELIPSPISGQNIDRLTLAIVGGMICGLGSGITLRSGSSTGGLDIISQYFFFKKHISFAKFSLSIDFIIIILGGIVNRNIETSIFTSVRLVVNILTLDQVYTIYKLLRVSIVTDKMEELRSIIISKFNHGITIYEVVGGFSGQKKYVLESIVSRFEAEEYKAIAKKIDEKSFITFSEVKSVDGFFNHNVIA